MPVIESLTCFVAVFSTTAVSPAGTPVTATLEDYLEDFENSWFESGEGLKLFNFMETTGKSFGFCRPYTRKDASRPEGYNEEKWHYSYMPISKHYTDFAEKHLNNSLIKGFLGSEVANEIDVVNNYVLGINRSCNH